MISIEGDDAMLQTPPGPSNPNPVAGGVLGGILGAALGGPVGALVGALIGFVIGNNVEPPRRRD